MKEEKYIFYGDEYILAEICEVFAYLTLQAIENKNNEAEEERFDPKTFKDIDNEMETIDPEEKESFKVILEAIKEFYKGNCPRFLFDFEVINEDEFLKLVEDRKQNLKELNEIIVEFRSKYKKGSISKHKDYYDKINYRIKKLELPKTVSRLIKEYEKKEAV
ncbi:hypothetical protein [Brassicibacter mesophilus]|uniref:hypothetical protein n=1 Tax=Brassicibacter mesophilus TaxID=745119 RepID=UPI003D1D1E38